MTYSPVMSELKVNGHLFAATFTDQLLSGTLALGARKVSAFDFSVIDRDDLALSAKAGQLFREGSVITWEGFAFAVNFVGIGGGTDAPLIEVSATSEAVGKMSRERGGHSWGTTEVSEWAETQIIQTGAKAIVQPNLGERDIAREEDADDPENGPSTWDTMVEMAKQTGAWVFDYDDTVIFAKPSWLANLNARRKFLVKWNSWYDHTDALTTAPLYTWKEDTKTWEGREELTLTAIDTGTGGDNVLWKCKPGDIIDYSGAACPTDDPVWIVIEVRHAVTVGEPTTIIAWRPIDPPEILPDDSGAGGEGTGDAGVPVGPLGKYGWTGEQLENAVIIINEGQKRELPRLAQEIAVMVAMGESSLINKKEGDAAGPDSTGLFQQRDTWGPIADRRNPTKAAGLFYDALEGTDYRGTFANGGRHVISGVFYGGKGQSAVNASVAAHHVQRNADAEHYAHLWADAQLVVKECLDVGKAASGKTLIAPGKLGREIKSLMKSYLGKSIDVDNFGWQGNLYQCYDLAQKYLTDLTGIGMIRGDGWMWWQHSALSTHFTAIPRKSPPRQGDIASWPRGVYTSVGHVAIYSHVGEDGRHWFLTQNPGAVHYDALDMNTVSGWMRPKAKGD